MKSIQWMCTKCGQKQTRTASTGRPMPGRCSRSKTGGPHRWVKNMTIGKQRGKLIWRRIIQATKHISGLSVLAADTELKKTTRVGKRVNMEVQAVIAKARIRFQKKIEDYYAWRNRENKYEGFLVIEKRISRKQFDEIKSKVEKFLLKKYASQIQMKTTKTLRHSLSQALSWDIQDQTDFCLVKLEKES